MKLIKNQLIIFFAILILTSCNSTFNVTNVKDNAEISTKGGVYYALPRNQIIIDFTLIETEKIKGPYAAYAEKYLGLKSVYQSNVKSYEISDISIRTVSTPDPENFYFVELGNKQSRKSTDMMLELSEAGLIQNVNEKSDQKVQENLFFESDTQAIDYSQTFKYFADANLYEKIDTVIELVNLDTITIEKTILKRRLVEKTMEQKAKEAADFIMLTKESRFNIITGFQEVAYERGTLQYMYEELENLENEYMKLFTGITITRKLKYRYTYMPESNTYSASVPLFKFSKRNGIVEADDEQGEIVYIQIDRQRNTDDLSKFIQKKGEVTTEKKHGIYYRIPEYAKFTIKQGATLKAEASFLISQFGIVTYLPVKRSKIQFYQNSGAIKSVGIK